MPSNKILARSLLIAAAGAVAAGCGTSPASQSELAPIHSVFVKPIDEPRVRVVRTTEMYDVFDWTPSGTNVRFDELAAQKGLHPGAEIREALTDAFRKHGYATDTSSVAADAVVEVKIEGMAYFVPPPGFALFGSGCNPHAEFDITMRNTRTGSTILSHHYRFQTSGYAGVTGDMVFAADPKYVDVPCDSLWSEPQLPVDAFRSAIQQLAQSVGNEVAKSGAGR